MEISENSDEEIYENFSDGELTTEEIEDDSIRLIGEKVANLPTPTSYTATKKINKTKDELVVTYKDLCTKLEKEPLSSNRLKKTKKADLSALIDTLLGKGNTISKDDKIIIDKETNQSRKIFSEKKKCRMARNIVRLNATAFWCVEKVNDHFSDKTGVILDGMTSDLLHPDLKEQQVDIFKELVVDFPEMGERLGTSVAAYVSLMATILTRRAIHNKKNPKKKKITETDTRSEYSSNVRLVHKNQTTPDDDTKVLPKSSFVYSLNSSIGDCPV